MGKIKDVHREEAMKKIQELANAADICLFATNLTELPISARPMSRQGIADDGTIWFFSEKDSHKNQHIELDNRVQLFFSNTNNQEYLSIYGTAEIIKDDEKARELWSPMAKTWFHEGPEDPSLTIIKVTPEHGYYWDTKNGKLITLLKMVSGAIAGKEIDGSVEGRIEI
ncbi:MAG: pyridoxamine 5'-phosphate oxidase family protein [Chitinophagaceae bacterium]|nr:pyridoxamine 5'-phosphate oxidase family protein [Chitinophagaceae bacterium]